MISCEYCKTYDNIFFTEHLWETASGSWIWKHFPLVNKESVTLKDDVSLFSRLLSLSREQDVYVQNLLSRNLCAIPLDLFYLNGAIEGTAKSNLLNEIEIKRYSLPSLMRNPGLGTTVTDFMAILQSIDYCNFESFSSWWNFYKLFSSFRECEVLVVVPDRYDFKFSVKAAERKHQTEDSTHIQEIEIIDNRKVPKSFQSYLGNSINKINLGKYLFEKWREELPKLLASSQTIYSANLDGATDCKTSRSSKGTDFYCDHKYLYIKVSLTFLS